AGQSESRPSTASGTATLIPIPITTWRAPDSLAPCSTRIPPSLRSRHTRSFGQLSPTSTPHALRTARPAATPAARRRAAGPAPELAIAPCKVCRPFAPALDAARVANRTAGRDPCRERKRSELAPRGCDAHRGGEAEAPARRYGPASAAAPAPSVLVIGDRNVECAPCRRRRIEQETVRRVERREDVEPLDAPRGRGLPGAEDPVGVEPVGGRGRCRRHGCVRHARRLPATNFTALGRGRNGAPCGPAYGGCCCGAYRR